MGSSSSSSKREALNYQIEQQTSGEAAHKRKVLLLGAGEGGKATFFKHARASTQSEASRRSWAESIKTVGVMHTAWTLACLYGKGAVLLTSPQSKEAARKISEIPGMFNPFCARLVEEHSSSILKLLSDLDVAHFLDNRYKHPEGEDLIANAKYFADNAARILAPDYLPSVEDILRLRIKTTGLTECSIERGSQTISILLVGSQRSERKKWLHVFEGTEVICFFVSLIEYNQVLYEDGETNRLVESRNLFSHIYNSPFLRRVKFVLVLNLLDLFLLKKAQVPVCSCSPICDFNPSLSELHSLNFLFPGSNCYRSFSDFPADLPRATNTPIQYEGTEIPPSVWPQVVNYLNPRSLSRMRLVCKGMQYIVDNASEAWVSLLSSTTNSEFTHDDVLKMASLLKGHRFCPAQAAFIVSNKHNDIKLIASFILQDKASQVPILVTNMLGSNSVEQLMGVMEELLGPDSSCLGGSI
ncbi:guanine nucleotide-binding protein alpha-7 subunit [Pelomyxa schiedti]|nr:guanine nucleotide-binding protein alpha-7 subunit [Pelomyxa schiedti]